jgi:hypothetical protein
MDTFPESHVSRLNGMGVNAMKPGAIYRYLGIYLKDDETPGKPQLGDV